ncbi:hypothetical protein BgiMline_035447 [Biomphalaria glabrata]
MIFCSIVQYDTLVTTTADKHDEDSTPESKSRENLESEKPADQVSPQIHAFCQYNSSPSSALTKSNTKLECLVGNDSKAQIQNEKGKRIDKAAGSSANGSRVNSALGSSKSRKIEKSNGSSAPKVAKANNKNSIKTFKKVANKIIYEKRRSKFLIRQETNKFDENHNLVCIIKYLLTELTTKQGTSNDQQLDSIASTSGNIKSQYLLEEKLNSIDADTINNLIDLLLLNPDEIDTLDIENETLQLLIDFLHFRLQSRHYVDAVKDGSKVENQSGCQLRNDNVIIHIGSPATSSSSFSVYTASRHSHTSSFSSGNVSTSVQSTQESSVDPDSDVSTLVRESARSTANPDLPGTSQTYSAQSTWARAISGTRSHLLSNAPVNLVSLASTAVLAVTGLLDPLAPIDNSQYYTGLASILRRGPPQPEEQTQPAVPVPNRRRRLRPNHLQSVAPSVANTIQPRPQPLNPPPDSIPIAANIPSVGPPPRIPEPVLAQIRGFGIFPHPPLPPLVPPPPPPPAPPLPGQHIRPPQAHEAGQLIIRNQHLHHPPALSPLAHRRVSNVIRRHSSNSH